MAKPLDGPHNYRNSIEMHTPDMPKSSSDGPKPAGSVGPHGESNAVPDLAAFSNAHGQARSGDPYSPTTPGHLSMGPWMNESEHSYTPGQPTMVSHPPTGVCAAYDWPDATGGDLGHHPDGYER